MVLESTTSRRSGSARRSGPVQGEGRLFSDSEEVRIAYDNEDVDLPGADPSALERRVIETTVGRTLFNEIVPEPLRT